MCRKQCRSHVKFVDDFLKTYSVSHLSTHLFITCLGWEWFCSSFREFSLYPAQKDSRVCPKKCLISCVLGQTFRGVKNGSETANLYVSNFYSGYGGGGLQVLLCGEVVIVTE
jgi:predicted NAD/FAD-binding protein